MLPSSNAGQRSGSLADALNSFSRDNQAAAGLKTTMVLDAGVSVGYFLPEPKTGFLATFFPSDANWHPLYEHTKAEITENLAVIESSKLGKDAKTIKKQRVKQTVIESYTVKHTARFYMACLLVLVLVLMFWTFGMLGNPIVMLGVAAGCAYLVYSGVYAFSIAQNTGEAYWQQYAADLNGRLTVGKTLANVMAEYDAEETRMSNTAAMQQAQSTPTGELMAGLIGGFMAGSFRKQ
jgi:hypothetical protein